MAPVLDRSERLSMFSGTLSRGFRLLPAVAHPYGATVSQGISGSLAGRVTISAIAREAGVSVPTVSRVLNGRADVSPATRERVEAILREHGYRRRPAPGRASSGLI